MTGKRTLHKTFTSRRKSDMDIKNVIKCQGLSIVNDKENMFRNRT